MRYPIVDSATGELVLPPDPPLHPVKQYFLDHALDFRTVQPQRKTDNRLSAVIAAVCLGVC